MKGRGILAAAVLMMSASGCWLQAGFVSGRTANNDLETRITAATVAHLASDWAASVGGPTAAEPLVDGGTAYVRSAGRMSSFALATGAKNWSVAAGGANDVAGGSAAAPAMVDGSLWVPTTTGQSCDLMHINPADGSTIFVRHIAGITPGSIPPAAIRLARCQTGDALVAGSTLVVPATVQAQITTAPPFFTRCPGNVDQFLNSTSVTVIDMAAGTTYTLLDDASSCGSPLPGVAPFQPASVSGDQLLLAQGSLVTARPLAPCDVTLPCSPTWSVDAGGQIVGPPVVLNSGDVAVGRADGQVAVIDGATHAIEWTATVGPVLFLPLAATPTSIYAVSGDSAASKTILSALPAGGCGSATCTPTWTWTGPVVSHPKGRASIGGDVVYVTYNRNVTALPAAGCGATTCDPLWDGTTSTSASASSPPVIDNGELLVGNEDGTVAAFALPG